MIFNCLVAREVPGEDQWNASSHSIRFNNEAFKRAQYNEKWPPEGASKVVEGERGAGGGWGRGGV